MTTPTTTADLHPLADNPRTHPAANLDLLARALRQVGPARSGVIDENGVILAGNGTHQALAAAGITKIRVIAAQPDEWVVVQKTGLTPEQKRLLTYYDNRAGELAGWAAEAIISDVARGLDLPAAGVFDSATVEQFIHGAERAAREAYDFLTPPAPGRPPPTPGEPPATPPEPPASRPAPATRGQAATAPAHPLAIVLNRTELAQWTAYKQSIGTAADKAAFLQLLAAVTATGG